MTSETFHQPTRTRLFDPATDQHLIPVLAHIHAQCIQHDNQALVLLPPLTEEKMNGFWTKQSALAEAGTLAIILALEPHDLEDPKSTEEVAGVVCLAMSPSETGPFRGDVLRLLVSPLHRRKGVATRLMTRLEVLAKEKGRLLLMLDTTVGSDAQLLYPRLGYKEVGIIPRYTTSPNTLKLVDEIFYYKDLRDEQA